MVIPWFITLFILILAGSKWGSTCLSILITFWHTWNSRSKLTKIQNPLSIKSSSNQVDETQTQSSPNAQLIDIPSGKWIHELHLHDDASSKASSISFDKVVSNEQHPRLDNSFSSSTNPFLKHPCVIDRSSSHPSPVFSVSSAPLSRITLEEKHQLPGKPSTHLSSIIRPSRWKHIALGLGKPFLRRHTVSSSSTPTSTTKTFSELLSRRESSKFTSSSFPRPAFPWPSLDSLSPRGSIKKRPALIIREPMVKQFHVKPPLDDLQQRLSNVCLEKRASSLNFGYFRRLVNTFHLLGQGLSKYPYRFVLVISHLLNQTTCPIFRSSLLLIFPILFLTLLLTMVSMNVLPSTFLNPNKEGFPQTALFINDAHISSFFSLCWSYLSWIRNRWINPILTRIVTGIYSNTNP